MAKAPDNRHRNRCGPLPACSLAWPCHPLWPIIHHFHPLCQNRPPFRAVFKVVYAPLRGCFSIRITSRSEPQAGTGVSMPDSIDQTRHRLSEKGGEGGLNWQRPFAFSAKGRLVRTAFERIDKPNSVLPAGRPAAVIIYLGRRLPAASSDQPEGQDEQPCGAQPKGLAPRLPTRSCSRWGLPSRPSHLGRWWSLTPPFHAYRPGLVPQALAAPCSLLHLPSGRPAWTLSSIVLCGVRTFLRRVTPARDHLTLSKAPRVYHSQT